MINPRFLAGDFYKVTSSAQTVVMIGDAFTEGTLSKGPTYPSVLQNLLLHAGWHVNMVNMGLAKSGPDQHLRLFKQYLLPKLTPDIVIWTFYANDIWDNI